MSVQLQASIDACPVDCIHWVDRQQLPALEYVMQKRMGRTNVGVMMAGQGGSTGDVFELTLRFLKEREARWGYYPPRNKVSVVHYVVCPHTGRMLQVVQTNKGCALFTTNALSRLLLQAVLLAIAYSSGLRESAVLAVKSPYCNAWQDALSSVVLLPAVQAEGACGVAQVHAGAGGGTFARG